jgi:DNA repair protein RecO (recombination protein O)
VTTTHTHAILLRSNDFGESDRILHLLTPETGRVTVIAKGARRSVKRFGGNLDFFNHLRVQIEQRRPTSMARLELAKLERTFHGLREDPGRFALGCYVLEILDRLAPEGGAPVERERLFRFGLGALAWLDAATPDPRMRVLLELRTLDAVGLRPELSRCVRCGSNLGSVDGPIVPFRSGDGGPVCARCRTPEDQGLPIHLGTLRALQSSLEFELSALGRIGLAGQALDEAQGLIRRFLRFHVGLELRSEAVLEQLTLREPEGKLRPPRADL